MNVPLWSTMDLGKPEDEVIPLKDVVAMLLEKKR
jgi:hypothetical protein